MLDDSRSYSSFVIAHVFFILLVSRAFSLLFTYLINVDVGRETGFFFAHARLVKIFTPCIPANQWILNGLCLEIN